jgi:integrase
MLAVRTWLAKLEADGGRPGGRHRQPGAPFATGALVLVAAFGGLRWGELAGLRRKRVDLERGTVTVAEQLLEVNGAFSVGPPKSAAGRPTVALPAVVVEALAEHLARYTQPSRRRPSCS